MPLFDQTPHQKKQIEVINNIEQQIKSNSVGFNTVDPIEDYDSDPRLCLTGIHFPRQELLETLYRVFINPLKEISPNHYYYEKSSLHLTIKSVRVINNPPHFNEKDTEKAKEVFGKVIPRHHRFQVYFYRLLLFLNNLALIATTDPELDEIVLDLDKELKKTGIPDDKQYSNSQYFFTNMTLTRFNAPLTQEFKEKINELSNNLSIHPYTIDSVTLLIGNAALKKRKVIGNWNLL